MFILEEFLTQGFFNLLGFFSSFSIITAIFTITTKNPVFSIIFLIFLFGSISCYLNIISLNFIALSYLIVYIGAISILFLFILMLIDIRISELYNEFKNNNLFLIIIISIFTYLILFPLLPFELNISNLYVYTYNTYNFI
jgi:NADH-ubiquinone oxidoreductase chain 6